MYSTGISPGILTLGFLYGLRMTEESGLPTGPLREDVQRKKLPKFGHLAKDPYPTYLTSQFGQQKVWTIFFV